VWPTVSHLMADTRNDCEPVVRQHHPEVGEALHRLAGLGPARMTGTGACVFVPFSREGDARRGLSGLPTGWAGFVARGLNRSPLLTRGAA